jgi:hypothetical protein
MDASEGRIRALQRIAYGADATDAERALAVAELGELAARGAARGGVSAGPGDGRGPGNGSADATDAAATDAAATASTAAASGQVAAELGPVDEPPGRARLIRWTVVAGGICLLLGGFIGWAAGQRVPPEFASSSAAPSSSDGAGMSLESTALLPLFDRLPLAAESTRVAGVDDVIDPASVRLLATRTDGPAAFLTRTVDGENVCLVLMLPAGPSRSVCTVDGRFPVDGLSIQYNAPGYGLAVARLASTGTVAIGLIVTF